jgi:hypothetical protein
METGMKGRPWLYAGTALASGAWSFLNVWTGRNTNCIIEDCTKFFVVWFGGLAIILVAVVALLRLGGKERFSDEAIGAYQSSTCGVGGSLYRRLRTCR